MTTPCRHFLLGRCYYGDACRFLHKPITTISAVVDVSGDMNAGCIYDCACGVASIGHPFSLFTLYTFSDTGETRHIDLIPDDWVREKDVIRTIMEAGCSEKGGNGLDAVTRALGDKLKARDILVVCLGRCSGDYDRCREALEGTEATVVVLGIGLPPIESLVLQALCDGCNAYALECGQTTSDLNAAFDEVSVLIASLQE